jgi:hypothetical protein
MKLSAILISFFFFGIVSSEEPGYVFGWTHLADPDLQTPIGGSTTGPKIEIDEDPNSYWLELQNPGLSKYEKDRLAILGMQGGYKANFDFMETMGFSENYSPSRPYQSWGTEFVKVIEDKEDFISLQHIMVMFFEQDDGSISDPIVVKHWRQDWHYEDKTINVYMGDNIWKKQTVSDKEIQGKWSQSVYQVDDSPRYQGYGEWKHYKNTSTWVSEETNRPPPRRETTIRDDYDLLSGTNLHTITPSGWVHEQNNSKVLLNGKVLAKEIGLARYQMVSDFDWSAGEEYWDKTKLFWLEVRNYWKDTLEKSDQVQVLKANKEKLLFAELFGLADLYAKGNLESINEVDSLISKYVQEI